MINVELIEKIITENDDYITILQEPGLEIVKFETEKENQS